MSEAAEKLKPLLAALTRDERAEVVEYLTALNDDPDESGEGAYEKLTPEEWEEVWEKEINRRIADMDSGKTVGIPADEVMRRMKEKYG